MWTQETTKTGHVASFHSDSGIAYVWANQFDFDAGDDTVQFTITPLDRFDSQVSIFYDVNTYSYDLARQHGENLSNPESYIADWAEMAFHF